jgi:phenylalanyl-tRNA synthetase beta chain
MPGADVVPSAPRPYEHPARAGEVWWRGQTVGRLFEMHPSLMEGRAAILYMNLEAVLALTGREKRYTPLRRYPSSAFDLTVIAGARELAGDLLKKLISFTPPELLERAEYVRQYSGAPLAENYKSVSFRITVGSADSTLSAEQVGAIRNSIIDGMRGLGYELRV